MDLFRLGVRPPAALADEEGRSHGAQFLSLVGAHVLLNAGWLASVS